jgi:integrase/recombinase XerD
MSTVSLLSAGEPAVGTGRLRLAAAAYLARFTGPSRMHTESDLRVYLTWCAERGADPLAAGRPQVELYVRWMQQVRRLKPSTVSRRGVGGGRLLPQLRHRRRVDPPAAGGAAERGPGLSQPYDFALVCLLGLRIFEACGANIEDLGEEHGHRVLKVRGKGSRTVLVPKPPAVARAVDRAAAGRTSRPLLRNRYSTRMDRQAATRRLATLAQASRMPMPPLHPHMLRHTFVTTMLDAGVDLRDVHSLQGVYTAQRRANHGEDIVAKTPLIQLVLVNIGHTQRHWREMADEIATMTRGDHPVVAAVDSE